MTWNLLDEKMNSAKDSNPAWNIEGEYAKIEDLSVNQLVGKRLQVIQKSLLNYTITLERQPRPAFMYIIIPTIAITVFNLISLLLPGGGISW